MALYMDFNVSRDRIIYNPTAIFNYWYDKHWFDDEKVVKVACDIDKLKHESGDIFEHPIYGRCIGRELSGGVHTVLAAYFGLPVNDMVLPLSWLGENCFAPLGSLEIKNDIIFDGDYTPQIDDWHCSFISKKTGSILSNYDSYSRERSMYGY